MPLPQSPFWVGYTTSTEEWPERFKRPITLPVEIVFRISAWFCTAWGIFYPLISH